MGKYLDKIRQHEQGEPIPLIEPGQVAPVLTIQPGDRIAWDRAGMTQVGVVDFLHVDAEGAQWAFTVGKAWSAVNMKFATVATPADVEAATKRAAPSCFACGSTRRWLSIHGAIVCALCHPPASENLIVGWMEGDQHETRQA